LFSGSTAPSAFFPTAHLAAAARRGGQGWPRKAWRGRQYSCVSCSISSFESSSMDETVAMTTPRDPELTEALIDLRVSELRLLAAKTAVEYWRERVAQRWRELGFNASKIGTGIGTERTGTGRD
jgi:hypothetical protein